MSVSAGAESLAQQRPRQVAVLDLGSNSWRLVIFSHGPGWWKRTDEIHETVRIGAGLDASGRLSDAAVERGLETLAVFARFCRAHGLESSDVHAVATSAIRDATNGRDFLRRATAETGLPIEVISAEEEARFGYVAAVNTTTIEDGAVVELGGGSIQLVEVRGRRAGDLRSFPLGAVRLTERFLPGSGPASQRELKRLRGHVSEVLERVGWLAGAGGRLVGTGGAVRNLAVAAQQAQAGTDIGVQGYVLEADALDQLVDELARRPVRQRGSLPGIKPGREDIVLAAAATLQSVMQVGRFDGVEATEAGLREGVFLARTLLAGQEEPLLPDVRRAAVQNLAVQYEADLGHVEHVAELALGMHDSLVQAGVFAPRPGERELLWAAAMLHDVGMAVSYDDHHKHSHYLILSAELPGFDPRERALIAQISRYHRKGAPKLAGAAPLVEDRDQELLERCAVILRLAEHLERGRDRAVTAARLRDDGDGIALHLQAAGDLTLPRWTVERYGDDEAFERVFGRPLVIG